MLTSQVLSIDVGSGFIKAVTIDGRRFIIPSRIARRPDEMDQAFSGQSNKGVIRLQGGSQWIFGDEAVATLPSQLVDTRSDGWAGSPAWLALVLAAIARAGFTSGEVRVVLGVPQKVWSPSLRDSIIRALVRRHSYQVDGNIVDIEIVKERSMVMPQAYGGLSLLTDHDHSLSVAAEAGAEIAGIDIGTYTTGFVVFQGGRFNQELSGGAHNVGIWQIAGILANLLDDLHVWRPTLDQAMRAIMTPNKVFFLGKINDITDVVSRAAEPVAKELTARLQATWGKQASGMEIVVFGGGASLLLPFIQQVYPQARIGNPVIDDEPIPPQFAPAMGLLGFFITANHLV